MAAIATLTDGFPTRPRLDPNSSALIPRVVVLTNETTLDQALAAVRDLLNDLTAQDIGGLGTAAGKNVGVAGGVADFDATKTALGLKANTADLGTAATKNVGVSGGVASFEQVVDAALTQTTQELAGQPTDLPIGKQRLVWNTTKNAPSFWMNRGGTIIDAFNPDNSGWTTP